MIRASCASEAKGGVPNSEPASAAGAVGLAATIIPARASSDDVESTTTVTTSPALNVNRKKSAVPAVTVPAVTDRWPASRQAREASLAVAAVLFGSASLGGGV